jgi:subtilisin family serine protease
VLSVGAIGRLGTFPPDSGLAAQLTAPPTAEGFFVPRFANQGPGIDCCAPGVAIVSGLPPASYGPLSGSAIAAGHVAAVAALVLAHHPQFAWSAAGPAIARDASRVDRLFRIILGSCRPLPELGPQYVGSGLPDAGVAVGVAPAGDFATLLPAASTPGSQPASGAAGSLAGLEAAMRSAGLLPRS